jgi:hypothetical protein
MSGPSIDDIEQMRRFRKIMESADASPTKPTTENHSSSPKRVAPAVGLVGGNEQQAMKEILERLHRVAGDASYQLNEEASYDPEVREALHTLATPNGVMIGGWEVKISLDESSKNNRKFYTVVNTTTKEIVSENLIIHEAALAIVKYLNKGYMADHVKIKEVLDLEETFNRNRMDAKIFKHRFNRCQQLDEQEASDVFASRYQTARANALAAQDQIQNIFKSTR